MNEVIGQFEMLQDLGLIVLDEASFDAHIYHVVKKLGQKTGLVSRIFDNGSPMFMKKM